MPIDVPPPRCGIQGCDKPPTPGHAYCDQHGEQLDGLEWSDNGWRHPSLAGGCPGCRCCEIIDCPHEHRACPAESALL